MDDLLDTPDYSGDAMNAQAAGVNTYTPDVSLPGDTSDDSQMQQWSTATPAQAQAGMPWSQAAILNGISKAIDNTFPTSPTGVMGNVYPGSGASVAGRTYQQIPQGAGGGTTVAAKTSTLGGIPVLYLVVGAALLYVLTR